MAEDNPVNQKLATRILEKLGFRADAVANGVEAIVQIAVDLKSALAGRSLAQASSDEPRLFWTAGLHPEAANSLEQLDELLQLIRESRGEERFLGVG